MTHVSSAAPARGLRLLPFRGLRFDRGRLRDPAAVPSPPYDMIDPEQARRLADAEEHNVVRLILPAHDETTPADRYRRAERTLREWRADGVITQDDTPALYIYQQDGPFGRQRGIIGALGLPDKLPGAVLPHEDVVPAVVVDRQLQMERTAANLEPILLSYGGDGPASDVVDAIATGGPAGYDVSTPDQVRHRLWALTDQRLIGVVADDLAWRRALIADGHHRYAAYLGLRDRSTLPGAGSGLALLVDSARYPLRVHGIHRTLPTLRTDVALAAVRGQWQVRAVGDDLTDALGRLSDVPDTRIALLLSDGAGFWLLSDPKDEVLETIPGDRPESWRRLDSTVLQHALVRAAWRVADTPEMVGFDHDARQAVRRAALSGGTAVLLRPASESVVRDLAIGGVRMPRKSTSFGPKPATGLVMRSLLD